MIEIAITSISVISFVVLGISIYRTSAGVDKAGTITGEGIGLRFFGVWMVGLCILIASMYSLWILPIDTTLFALVVVAVFLSSILYPTIMYLLNQLQNKS